MSCVWDFFYLFLFIELLGQPTEASWGIISNGNVKIYGWQQFVLSNEHAIKLSRGKIIFKVSDN